MYVMYVCIYIYIIYIYNIYIYILIHTYIIYSSIYAYVYLSNIHLSPSNGNSHRATRARPHPPTLVSCVYCDGCSSRRCVATGWWRRTGASQPSLIPTSHSLHHVSTHHTLLTPTRIDVAAHVRMTWSSACESHMVPVLLWLGRGLSTPAGRRGRAETGVQAETGSD
jgi:hypothetical protein